MYHIAIKNKTITEKYGVHMPLKTSQNQFFQMKIQIQFWPHNLKLEMKKLSQLHNLVC